MSYLVHVAGGALGLVAGFVALYSTKGASLHRRTGMVFVWAMLAMCVGGLVMTIARGVAVSVNLPAGLLTSYLVITALIAVRPPSRHASWVDPILLIVALSVGLVCLGFGWEAIATGRGRDGMPAFPFFMFGIVGTLGAAGDVRVIRSGALRGSSRMARHLWRMCFALFIAALSFFIGQADVFPKSVRIMPLLAMPVLAVFVTMLYWLWRVRIRGSLRGLIGPTGASATAREPARVEYPVGGSRAR